jgi:predicted peptidase
MIAITVFYAGLPVQIETLKNVPVWAFHGDRDRTVALAESADLVYALKKCGAAPRFTIYLEAEHDSWTETYENPELYRWFLDHAK